eukprot:SAG31_NODE_176_length_21334_cov_12.211067_24_plen_99_part_00
MYILKPVHFNFNFSRWRFLGPNPGPNWALDSAGTSARFGPESGLKSGTRLETLVLTVYYVLNKCCEVVVLHISNYSYTCILSINCIFDSYHTKTLIPK